MASPYGDKFDNYWPEKNALFTKFGLNLLKRCAEVQKPNASTIADVIDESEKFNKFVPFPIQTCRILSQPKDRYGEIEKQINSAYPVIHERVLWLYLKFLEHKTNFGSPIEQEVYNDIDICGFVQRLLSKRCITFVGQHDRFYLLDGHICPGGDFTKIGTDSEEFPLVFKNCISYDEMKLSAFLSVSSHTEFINDGNRLNRGVVEEDKSKIEQSGVVIGLIGARFAKKNFMEFQDIIITAEQNIKDNGYGSKDAMPEKDHNLLAKTQYRALWNEFYDEKDFLYEDAEKYTRRGRLSTCCLKDSLFDNLVMKKRNTISFDTLLLESEARAFAAGKQAYIHVVGIGLGVWATAVQQTEIFLLTFCQRIKALLPKLNHVSYIHFSWFKTENYGGLKDGKFFKSNLHINGGIKTFISNRNPGSKMVITKKWPIPLSFFNKSEELRDCLSIVSYAWDSNALPGNEFWLKSLHTSSDPAAASSTLITELHNPHVNRDQVNGQNLHIASEKYGVIHISDYAKNMIALQ